MAAAPSGHGPALAPASPAVSTTFRPPPHRAFSRCPLQNDLYEKQRQVGKGQFGTVFKALCKRTSKVVALKKVSMKMETEGFPLTSMREIKLMSALDHPNVLKLHAVVHSPANDYNRQLGDVYLVFDFMDYDLGGLLNKGTEFTLSEIKGLSKQLLTGLLYLATNAILHRDLKVANLLLSRNGVLKIADFGLARAFSANGSYTGTVCTRWYRPPELLLGEKKYTLAIDMWSAGCIIAELFTGSPLLQGGVADARDERDNDIDQFLEICKLCGSPKDWEGFQDLRFAKFIVPRRTFPRALEGKLMRLFKSYHCPEAIDLLDQVFVWNPAKRLTPAQALDHDFFWKDPMPCDPDSMRSFGNETHDAMTKPVARRNIRPLKYMADIRRDAGLDNRSGQQQHKPHAPPPPSGGTGQRPPQAQPHPQQRGRASHPASQQHRQQYGRDGRRPGPAAGNGTSSSDLHAAKRSKPGGSTMVAAAGR